MAEMSKQTDKNDQTQTRNNVSRTINMFLMIVWRRIFLQFNSRSDPVDLAQTRSSNNVNATLLNFLNNRPSVIFYSVWTFAARSYRNDSSNRMSQNASTNHPTHLNSR